MFVIERDRVNMADNLLNFHDDYTICYLQPFRFSSIRNTFLVARCFKSVPKKRSGMLTKCRKKAQFTYLGTVKNTLEAQRTTNIS